MKIYIYPNGEVHQTIQSDMSDDYLTISSETKVIDALQLIEAHFGHATRQFYQVWGDIKEFYS